MRTKTELPRERLLRTNPGQVSFTELISVLLGTGVSGKPVLSVAHDVSIALHTGNRSAAALSAITGVGPAKAATIVAALELSRRLTQHSADTKLNNPAALYAICADLLSSEQEWFAVFLLNAHNQLIERRLLSLGTVDSAPVHPRDVFREAVRTNATCIAVAHNHPSGSLQPSAHDKITTKRLAEAGSLLGITLIDHIICTADGYVSLRLVDSACFCNTLQ
jgi:DNA repair protein RadC